MNESVARALYAIPWILMMIAVGWLLLLRVPPSGVATFDIPFNGTSAWIHPFLPAERTSSPGDQPEGWTGQRIIDEPVYTSALLPGVYDTMTMEIEFRPIRQTLIEIGIQPDPKVQAYDFQPIWFEALESAEWATTFSGERRGFVRSALGASALNSANWNTLAIWHASTTAPERMDSVGRASAYEISLRGSHDFWVIPLNGSIDFTFDLQDSNRRQGRETIVFQLLQDGELLQTEAVGIGGSQDERMGTMFSKRVHWDGLEPGIYRVQFVAEDDVFIRRMTTSHPHWVIGPRLSFGDLVGFKDGTQEGRVWTNSRHVVFETFHSEGLQTVLIGGDEKHITDTHESFRYDRNDAGTAPVELVAPVGDIRVIGDGFFALSQDLFFAPEPRRITSWTDPSAEGIDAILTPYQRPEPLDDGWYRAHISFDLNISQDVVRLALGAPGILTRAGAVDIRRVQLTYKRPTLSPEEWWRVVRQELVNAWRRVRHAL